MMRRTVMRMSDLHTDAKCADRERCSGPGCRRTTGKTARKANLARSHYNKRNAEQPKRAS